jgi:hypothetical protein
MENFKAVEKMDMVAKYDGKNAAQWGNWVWWKTTLEDLVRRRKFQCSGKDLAQQ